MNFNRGIYLPLAVSRDIIIQELAAELLIYNQQTHRAMSLNETVAAVWQHCNGKNPVREIAEILSAKFKTRISEEIVLLALETLGQHDLLVESPAVLSEALPGGVSRRELVRRAALSTAVALPVIAALAAPKAARAASNQNPNPNGLADGVPCALDAQCRSGCCTGFCDDPAACFI